MKITPLKYPLETGLNRISIPGGLHRPHFGFQYEQRGNKVKSLPRIWTHAELNKPKQEVSIYVGITGQEVPHKVLYCIGTAVNTEATWVLHAYVVEE